MYTEELIKIIAKKADIDISKFDMKELVMGMSVELEHGSKNEKTDITGDDPEATFKIVLAHMYELPDYYTRLKKMEKKENISEYARRMRELAGLADGNQHKTLKTVQNGESSFEGGATFYAKDMTGIIKENFASPEFYEDEKSEAMRYLNNTSGWVTVLYDPNQNELVIYKDVSGLNIDRDEIEPEEQENYMELSVDEVMDILNNGGVRVYTKDSTSVEGAIFESDDKDGEFETHKFEQKTIEDGENDQELYNLNENTIIVLDFLDDGDEK